MSIAIAIEALANERRLQIIAWLKEPEANFPPQVDGDLAGDGVCGIPIAKKLAVSGPTVSEQPKVLSQAGLVQFTRIRQWTFYKHDEERIAKIKKEIASEI